MVAHNKSYVKVLIPKDEELYGKELLVKIKEVSKWHCVGEIIDKNPKPITVDYNEYFKDILRQKKVMIQNYENSLSYNNKENGDSYSIHDTFKVNKKNEEDDLRKYKQYYEKKNTNNYIEFLLKMFNIFSVLYFIYSLIKYFKLF